MPLELAIAGLSKTYPNGVQALREITAETGGRTGALNRSSSAGRPCTSSTSSG